MKYRFTRISKRTLVIQNRTMPATMPRHAANGVSIWQPRPPPEVSRQGFHCRFKFFEIWIRPLSTDIWQSRGKYRNSLSGAGGRGPGGACGNLFAQLPAALSKGQNFSKTSIALKKLPVRWVFQILGMVLAACWPILNDTLVFCLNAICFTFIWRDTSSCPDTPPRTSVTLR